MKLGLSIFGLIFAIVIWPIIMYFGCIYKATHDAVSEDKIVGSILGGIFGWIFCWFFTIVAMIAMIITFSILIHKYRKTI